MKTHRPKKPSQASLRKAKALALKSTRRHLGLVMKEAIAEQNPEALFLGDRNDTTYDDALIGFVERAGHGAVACYDYEKCCDCLQRVNPHWAREDAIEWMDFNVASAYMGPNSPVFLHKPLL